MKRLVRCLAVILANLWFYPMLLVWSLASFILYVPATIAWWLATRWEIDRITRHLVWIYGWVIMLIMRPFVRFRVDDFDRFGNCRPGIIVANHLSFLDTYLMGLLPVWDVRICLRSWPFRMAWYTPFMKLARYLDLEGTAWPAILAEVRQSVARNHWLLIFPEGHRSRSGMLQRFHTGAFKLAQQTGLPILPLCISGSDRLLPPNRWWVAPCTVHLRALPPVELPMTDDETSHSVLCKQVRKRMGEEVQLMRQGTDT
jgi:1-acyl-sn-glycerol-3-phosphate acyltransferase